MVLDKTRADALARVEALIEAAHRVEMIGALGSRRDLVRAINDVATARESAATALAELRSEETLKKAKLTYGHLLTLTEGHGTSEIYMRIRAALGGLDARNMA